MNDTDPIAAGDVLRLFVAVALSDEVRARLSVVQDTLRQAPCRVGWVAPGNLHLTLAFLGDVFGAQVEGLAAALDAVAASHPPFACEVAGVGAFGPPRAPRILWAGVEDPSGALGGLQAGVAAAVSALGFRPDGRPFTPHLTLGRVRERRGEDALTSLLSSIKTIRCGRVEVSRLLLMRSRLLAQGASYSAVHRSALKGA